MSEHTPIPAQIQMDPKYVVAPLEVYANQVRMGATLQDFTVILGVIEEIGMNQVINRDRLVVRLSPATAKIMQANLTTIISAYEESVGPIAISGRLQPELDNIKARLVTAFREQMQIGPVVNVSTLGVT